MIFFAARRACQLIAVILLASFFTFSLTYLSPSDPAEMMLTSHDIVPTKELLEKQREEMGLNKPFMAQYALWLTKVIRGDLGFSYSKRVPVAQVINKRIFMTVKLALVSILFLVIISLLSGIAAALNQDRLPDYIIRAVSFAGISVPSFWLGLMLILIFVVKVHWFKITDPYAPASVILPALTLGIPLAGRYIRQIRAAILEEKTSNYVKGARSRGIKEYEIVLKHILPNAFMGIVTLLGLSTAMLLGGTVIVEHIFSWPGLGSMALEAITYRDYPLLQSYVLFMSLIYVGINFLVDLTILLLDPRVRMTGGNHAKT